MSSSGPIDPEDVVAAAKTEDLVTKLPEKIMNKPARHLASAEHEKEFQSEGFGIDLDFDQSLFQRIREGIARAVKSGYVGVAKSK